MYKANTCTRSDTQVVRKSDRMNATVEKDK